MPISTTNFPARLLPDSMPVLHGLLKGRESRQLCIPHYHHTTALHVIICQLSLRSSAPHGLDWSDAPKRFVRLRCVLKFVASNPCRASSRASQLRALSSLVSRATLDIINRVPSVHTTCDSFLCAPSTLESTRLHRVSKMNRGTWCSWFITFASHFGVCERCPVQFRMCPQQTLFFLDLSGLSSTKALSTFTSLLLHILYLCAQCILGGSLYKIGLLHHTGLGQFKTGPFDMTARAICYVNPDCRPIPCSALL